MPKEKRNSFTFYRDFYNSAQPLNDSQRLQLYEAIIKKSIDNIDPKEDELDPLVASMYSLAKHALSKSYKGWMAGIKHQPSKGPSKGNTKDTPKQDKDKDKDKDNIDYLAIVSYLNNKCNTQFRSSTDKTRKLIKARFNEGFTYEDFVKVIDIKCSQWLMKADMKGFLRPETLFGTKFEGYLNEEITVSTQEPVVNRSTEW